MKVLITGGAGYIGSVTTHYLRSQGHETVVFDNLSRGHADAVRGPLVVGDLCVRAEVDAAMAEHQPDAVMHFAAHSQVAESVARPRLYFHDNLVGAMNLLDAMRAQQVRYLVFSSTAATYGEPKQVPIPEDHPQEPVNPYGDTKLTIERMLRAYDHAYGLRFAALRYFNAAGGLASEGLGERHDPETHLIPLVLQVPAGQRPVIKVFGQDYDTPDGSCVRDYIHVLDLAEAHLAALEWMAAQDQSLALNLGTGRGYSVREVIDAARRVTGAQIPSEDAPRRPGDPPALVASAERALEVLGWKATHSDIEQIIASAWDYHQLRAGGEA
jgi:UDP-glucose-4-epimerase GalE